MKTLRMFLLGLFLATAGTAAQARDSVSLSLSFGYPVYYDPPPAIYYAPPPVVYYRPAPAYYAGPWGYYRYDEPRHRHHHHKHWRKHERHDYRWSRD